MTCKHLKCGLITAGLILTGVTIGRAEVAVHDPFTDGARSNGPDARDVDWYYTSGHSLSVNADDDDADAANGQEIDAGNALFVSSPDPWRQILANFEQQTLTSSRDKLKLTFDVRLTAPPPDGNSVFRAGLSNSNGTQASGDGQGSTANDDTGYIFQLDTGNNADLSLTRDTGVSGYLGGGDQVSLTGGARGALGDQNRHRGMLSVQFTDSGRIDLRARLDTHTIAASENATDGVTQFDQIGFGIGNTGISYAVDNVQVTRWRNVFDDTFDVGSTPTRHDDADDPNDTAWYKAGNVNMPGTGVINDSVISSGNAMDIDATSSFAQVITTFDKFTLGREGDAAELNFDYHRTNIDSTDPSTSASGFRFGLFDSNGTLVTGDGNLNSSTDDDAGYFFQVGVGASNTSLAREIGTDNGDGILGGANSGTGSGIIGSDTNYNLDDAAHHFRVLFTRLAEGLNVQMFIDGVLVLDRTDTSPDAILSFDELGFSQGSTGFIVDYRLDNVVLDTSIIPEPASAAVLILGLLGVTCRGRQRQIRL